MFVGSANGVYLFQPLLMLMVMGSQMNTHHHKHCILHSELHHTHALVRQRTTTLKQSTLSCIVNAALLAISLTMSHLNSQNNCCFRSIRLSDNVFTYSIEWKLNFRRQNEQFYVSRNHSVSLNEKDIDTICYKL